MFSGKLPTSISILPFSILPSPFSAPAVQYPCCPPLDVSEKDGEINFLSISPTKLTIFRPSFLQTLSLLFINYLELKHEYQSDFLLFPLGQRKIVFIKLTCFLPGMQLQKYGHATEF